MSEAGEGDEFQLRSVQVSDAVQLAFDEWPARGPRVVFLHATGFSRGCWRPHAQRIAARSQPVSLDLRGHGASSKPLAPYRWSLLVDDIVSLLVAEDWSNVLLVGHSVGGATAVQVAARLPERVAALVLVEAVVTPDRPPAGAGEPPSALVERTLRRRARWSSRAEAGRYLRARPPYDSWDAEVFAGWLDSGVIATDDGGVELSCPPWVEASVFTETRGSTAAQDLAHVSCPTWIARATGDRGLRSTCPPQVAQTIPTASETVIEGSGHFLPLENVGVVVTLLNAALDHMGKASSSDG
ncbi:MAG: alpha/beta hydrolase [Dehalococcoidia bacterium]|nr:alpha/beta hydrolase [Dehalococcoidia bacterium]